MIPLTLSLPLAAGLFGAVVGSFLNVAIYRMPREGLSVGKPRRSFCPACGYQITARDNVPILSWLLLGGRCRSCRVSIPVRYPLVEVLTAFLFGLATWRFVDQRLESVDSTLMYYSQIAELCAALLLVAACVVTTFIDLDFKIIPDRITWPGMASGLLLSGLAPGMHDESSLMQWAVTDLGWAAPVAALLSSSAGILTGIAVVLLVGWVGRLVFRQEAMGLGDVKFMGMAGAFLGWDGVLLVFFLGCFSGAVGGLVHRALTGQRYIAFGPYLSLGTILVLVLRVELLEFLRTDWPRFVRGLFS